MYEDEYNLQRRCEQQPHGGGANKPRLRPPRETGRGEIEPQNANSYDTFERMWQDDIKIQREILTAHDTTITFRAYEISTPYTESNRVKQIALGFVFDAMVAGFEIVSSQQFLNLSEESPTISMLYHVRREHQ